jgi:Ca-activated chloride channel homolog
VTLSEFNWRGFAFLYPWVLLALLALPLIAWWLGKRARVPSVPFPSLKPFKSLPLRRQRGGWRFVFILLPLALIIVAIARPRVPKGEVPDPSKGIDIMLALDFSSSMMQKDYHLDGKRVTRKEALIHVVKDFIGKRTNDRLGIVAFARGPWLVSPLTSDHEWALAAFKETESSRGTAIGEGVMAATHFLKKVSDRSKVIIVVTDGQNSSGPEPADIIPFVKREPIKVYSILIGPQRLMGERLMQHDMMQLSKATGGQLFQASNTKALETVYNMIDLLEKKALREKRYETFKELFPWFAGVALALVVMEIILRDVLRRRIP